MVGLVSHKQGLAVTGMNVCVSGFEFGETFTEALISVTATPCTVGRRFRAGVSTGGQMAAVPARV